MMGVGGWRETWMVGDVATEDEDEEGLDSTEVMIFSLVVGDKTSGVRGCNTVGSKMSSVTKLSERVLTRLLCGNVSRSRF
jgi:hypothetical protein